MGGTWALGGTCDVGGAYVVGGTWAVGGACVVGGAWAVVGVTVSGPLLWAPGSQRPPAWLKSTQRARCWEAGRVDYSEDRASSLPLRVPEKHSEENVLRRGPQTQMEKSIR